MTLAKNKLFAVAALPRNSENEQPGRNVGSSVGTGRTGSKQAPAPQHPISPGTDHPRAWPLLMDTARRSLLAQQEPRTAPVAKPAAADRCGTAEGWRRARVCSRDGDGARQPPLCQPLLQPADQHSVVAGPVGTVVRHTPAPRHPPTACQAPAPAAPREGRDGMPGGPEAGGHSPLRAAAAAGGLAQAHLQGPLGRRETSQTHDHLLAPPMTVPHRRLLASSPAQLQAQRDGLTSCCHGAGTPVPHGRRRARAPRGAGAAAGHAGRLSSPDPAG